MSSSVNQSTGSDVGAVRFYVHDDGNAVVGATCSLYRLGASQQRKRDSLTFIEFACTDAQGKGMFKETKVGSYLVRCHHGSCDDITTTIDPNHSSNEVKFDLKLNIEVVCTLHRDSCEPFDSWQACVGDVAELRISFNYSSAGWINVVNRPDGAPMDQDDPQKSFVRLLLPGERQLQWNLLLSYKSSGDGLDDQPAAQLIVTRSIEVSERTPQPISGSVGVALSRTATAPTADVSFWQGILNSTEQMSFNTYQRFMNGLFCDGTDNQSRVLGDRFGDVKRQTKALSSRRLLPFTDSDAYRVIKAATEAFVMVNCGVLASALPFDDVNDQAHLRRRDLSWPDSGLQSVFEHAYLVQVQGGENSEKYKTLPYLAVIRSKLSDIAIKLNTGQAAEKNTADLCTGILQQKLTNPCLLELIWSYWHEEGMLAQTMNAITRRFQNLSGGERDPLANLEIDPLRPLNNVLWGFVQDEQHRLSVVRRNYEYDHHYGLRLEGRAVQNMRPADSRSRFIEAFHNLLRLAAAFFKQDDDTTIKADAFPVLNALKEVHLILSQGAHNQFGDLPSTARIEMLMQQWLLARPEFREVLPTRIMTAYPEPWMDRVDAMKKLQGWSDTSVLHFRNLAIFGEQVLLSIRWGYWSDVQEPLQAFNWLRFFRPQIQGYTHAYRAATGVDLSTALADKRVDATLPSVLLQRRLSLRNHAARA